MECSNERKRSAYNRRKSVTANNRIKSIFVSEKIAFKIFKQILVYDIDHVYGYIPYQFDANRLYSFQCMTVPNSTKLYTKTVVMDSMNLSQKNLKKAF